jgi:acetoacetyl-CoA synthetase
MWESSGLIYEGKYDRVVDTSVPMDAIPQWFQGTKLNFAENILYSASPSDPSARSTQHKEDSKIALTDIYHLATCVTESVCL